MWEKIKNIKPKTKTVKCIRFSEQKKTLKFLLYSWQKGRENNSSLNRLYAASLDFLMVTTCVYKSVQMSQLINLDINNNTTWRSNLKEAQKLCEWLKCC